MQSLRATFDLEQFFRTVCHASRRALLLDYDGTLAPFRVERDQAFPYPEVRVMLDKLVAAGHTRLVIVSGRAVHDVWHLIHLSAPVEIWGSHGAERLLPDDTYLGPQLTERNAGGLARAAHWVEHNGLAVHCERKPASLAFHWRGEAAQHAQDLREAVTAAWQPIALEAELSLQGFDGGIELRIPQYTKGGAVRRILAEEGPDAAIAYLGDDLTDEDAFRAIDRHGLGVLVRNELRPTVAQLWLKPPAELLAFLQRWHAVCKMPEYTR